MYYGGGLGWLGMAFGGIMMLLFWGVVIVLAFFAIRALVRSNNGHGSQTQVTPTGVREDSALAILRDRYARGEIDKEQYDRMRTDLLG